MDGWKATRPQNSLEGSNGAFKQSLRLLIFSIFMLKLVESLVFFFFQDRPSRSFRRRQMKEFLRNM